MTRILRDRTIIAACLVLYALGMMMMSLGHSQAHPMGAPSQVTISALGALCSGDAQDQTADTHCPYCRLTDGAVAIIDINVTPHLIFAFAAFLHSEKPILQTLELNQSTPTRGPPITV